MPDSKPTDEETPAPSAKKEKVAKEEEPTIHDALKKAKEVEVSQSAEDDPMNDAEDGVGDPIVGVTGDMFRPPYVHKGDK
jgi:hypothetical protein